MTPYTQSADTTSTKHHIIVFSIVFNAVKRAASLHTEQCCVVLRSGECGCKVCCVFHRHREEGWEANVYACLPIKQHKATLRLAEQTNHDRIKVPPFSHSIAPQTAAPVPTEICFPPNISSLVAFCSHLLFPLTPPHSLKRWHRAAPKRIAFLFVLLAARWKVLESFMAGHKAHFLPPSQKKENKTAISFQQPSVD